MSHHLLPWAGALVSRQERQGFSVSATLSRFIHSALTSFFTLSSIFRISGALILLLIQNLLSGIDQRPVIYTLA